MVRPRAKELTDRELEVMHCFWKRGEASVADIRESLIGQGRQLAYTTVATLVRILCEKGFLGQVNTDRPFRFLPQRSFEDVSGSMLGDMVRQLFGGSREQLLIRLLGQDTLSDTERSALTELLEKQPPNEDRS